MTQLVVGRFAFTGAMSAPERSNVQAIDNRAPAPHAENAEGSLNTPATLQPVEVASPAAAKPALSESARLLSEQHADLHQVHSKARDTIFLKAAAAVAVLAPSATYLVMSVLSDQLLSAGQTLGAIAGGFGTAFAGLYLAASSAPELVRYFANRNERHPEYATSQEFELAKNAHLAAYFYTDRSDAVEQYTAVMSSATPVLQVKCAYGIMDLVERFVDPIDRASAIASLCANSGKELNNSKVMKHAAQEMSECAAEWVDYGLPSLCVKRAGWVEDACLRAHPIVSPESEQIAGRLLLASNRLQHYPAARHVILKAAHALADPEQVTKGNLEELLLGNAEDLQGKVKFDALKQICALKGISKAGLVSVAGQLEHLVPVLGTDDALVANKMISDLSPNSYSVGKRAKARFALQG